MRAACEGNTLSIAHVGVEVNNAARSVRCTLDTTMGRYGGSNADPIGLAVMMERAVLLNQWLLEPCHALGHWSEPSQSLATVLLQATMPVRV